MLFATGNPVDPATNQVTLLAGCDYKAADGNALAFVNNGPGAWNSLVSATVYFVAFRGNFPLPPVLPVTALPVAAWFPPAIIAPIVGTVVKAGSPNQQISFDLTAAQTAVRPSPSANDPHSYAVYAQLADGNVVPLLSGPLVVMGVGS